MGNCLITRLKESVQNSELRKMNEFVIDVKPYGSFNPSKSIIFRLQSGETNKEIRTSGTFVDENGNSLGNTITLLDYPNDNNIRISPSGGKIFFPYRYSSAAKLVFDMPVSYVEHFDLSELTNCFVGLLNITEISPYGKVTDIPLCYNIYIAARNVYGTVEDFVNRHEMAARSEQQTIDIYTAPNISGDFADFGFFAPLYHLLLRNTNISGSLESFVNIKRSLGVQSGTIETNGLGTNNNITFNGTPISAEVGTTDLSWTATTITYNGVTINA